AFLAELTHELRELFPAQARRQSPVSLRGFNTITMDGKAIKNVAKRLKLLRRIGGGLLGGRALVAMHYETGLVIGMHADEDGDANDVRFVPELLPLIRAEIGGPLLFLADSGFCYLQRRGIEQVFQKVTEVFHLQGLIGGTPKATVFQFAFCLLLYNLIQVIRGYVAAHQQRQTETISIENLFLDVHRQLTAWSVLLES